MKFVKFICCCLIFLSTVLSFYLLPQSGSNETAQLLDSTIVITLSAVGDLMCHSTQYKYAQAAADSFDFRHAFRFINSYLKEADFLIGNLETVTAGRKKKFSGYPLFNSPDEFVDALSDAGFDLLVTANNHSLDRGEFGLRRTIEVIRQKGLNYTGTYLTKRDRDSIRIYDIKGILLAVLSYTFSTNGIRVNHENNFLINRIEDDLIKNDIITAREKGADIVLIYFHFGEEYRRTPNNFQIDIVEKAAELGADIIIGSHPHVIQPIKFIKGENTRFDSSVVAFSLGNFLSNQRWRYSDAGVILNFYIEKNLKTGHCRFTGIAFIPTWVFRGTISGKKEFVILPVLNSMNEQFFPFLSQSDLIKMNEAQLDTKNILTKYNPLPKNHFER